MKFYPPYLPLPQIDYGFANDNRTIASNFESGRVSQRSLSTTQRDIVNAQFQYNLFQLGIWESFVQTTLGNGALEFTIYLPNSITQIMEPTIVLLSNGKYEVSAVSGAMVWKVSATFIKQDKTAYTQLQLDEIEALEGLNIINPEGEPLDPNDLPAYIATAIEAAAVVTTIEDNAKIPLRKVDGSLASILWSNVKGLFALLTANNVFTGTANRMPNQLAATSDAVMTKGLSNELYDPKLLKISRDCAGRSAYERSIVSLTTTGTEATITVNSVIAVSLTGKLILLRAMNPTALNGLYIVTNHTANTAVLTITTTKTNTFVSGKFSNAVPIAKLEYTGTAAAKLNGNVQLWYGSNGVVSSNEGMLLGCCPIICEKLVTTGNWGVIGVHNPTTTTHLGVADRMNSLVIGQLDSAVGSSTAYLCVVRHDYNNLSNGFLRQLNGFITGEIVGAGMTISNTTDY